VFSTASPNRARSLTPAGAYLVGGPLGRLHDVLPAYRGAGKVALGSEIRLVLDAVPDYVIPAKASFVASVAQFTPKTVETERSGSS